MGSRGTRRAPLPGKGHREPRFDRVIEAITAGTEATSHVQLAMNAPGRWTPDGERDVQVLALVQIRLCEVLREDLSGVYGVQANASLMRDDARPGALPQPGRRATILR